MKIKKLTLINWSNLENKEFELTDLVFLTGETGVGKSTLLDAIQTVLTAAHSSIVNYNAGQSESEVKQQHKEYRSMAGYFLGEDRGLYSRPYETTGTIALTFYPSANEDNEIINAIVNTRCFLIEQGNKRTADIDDLNLFIVKGNEIFFDDFIEKSIEGNKILLGKDLYKKLQSCGRFSKENILSFEGKESYLSSLYASLWGRKSVQPEIAKKAAKALSKFIYAKPVDNINNFIRNEFLEQKSMKEEISNLSSAIKTLNDIKEDSKVIERGIIELNRFSSDINTVLSIWEANKKDKYLYELSLLNTIKNDFQKKKKEFEDNEIKQKKINTKLLDIKKQIETEEELKLQIKNKLSNNKDFQQISQLESDLTKQISNITDIKMYLQQQVNFLITQLRNTIKILTNINIEGIDKEIFNELFLSLEKLVNYDYSYILGYDQENNISNIIDKENFHSEFGLIFNMVEEIIYAYNNVIISDPFQVLKEKIRLEYFTVSDKHNQCTKDISKLEEEIKKLEEDKVFCPDHISKEYDYLCSLIPDASLSMLYQHVELKEEEIEWAPSIEGFLKNNRFAIIAPYNYEFEAINIVNKNKLKNIKIIQAQKMINELEIKGDSYKHNSMISKLIIADDIAKAFLINNYKNVLCLDTEEEVTAAGRGITINCKGANGGTMFHCKANELVFGEAALEAILYDNKEKLLIEEANKKIYSKSESNLRVLNRELDNFSQKHEYISENKREKFSEHYNLYLKFRESIKCLKVDDYLELQEQLNLITEKLEELGDKKDELIGENAVLVEFYKKKSSVLDGFSKSIDSQVKSYEESKSDYQNILLCIQQQIIFEELDKLADVKNSPPTVKEAITEKWSEFVKKYSSSTIFEDRLIEYNENEEITSLSKTNIQKFTELYNENKKINREIDRLSNSLQIKYKKEIEKGEQKVRNIFVNSFCDAIYRNILLCKVGIDQFSEKLTKHKFENEKFIISTLDAEPEYEEYKRYFKYIAENKDMTEDYGSLLNTLEKEELEKTKEKLFDLFMSNETHHKQLENIADYRNYFRYDIIQDVDGVQISLSKNGKNSGGQGETSYYIVRSINLHSALNPSVSRNSTLETLLIDESFLKTNDKRAKEIIDYLNRTLGFQVVFALPTKASRELNTLPASNYHIVKEILTDRKHGELKYTTWARFSKRNAKEVKILYDKKRNSLFAEAEIEAKEEYEKSR